MKQRLPNSKLLCCASIIALSLTACSHQPKVKPAPIADIDTSASNHIVKLKKGHRSKKLGLTTLPDPRSYDNLWDRLFDRFDLPPVDRPEVERELSWFINHPTYIERVQSRAEPFLYSIVKQLEKQNLPGELALLPVIESAFQPHVVSPAHAAGIWQFIPTTGRHYGLKQSHSYDGRRDIYASTRAAIKYLKKLHNDFGDWLLAIGAYNCGEGAVSRAIQRNANRGLPTDFWSLDLPQETRSYVPRLLAVSRLFSESEQYGIELRPIPNKALYKTVKLNKQVDLAVAANAAEISLERMLELNPGFKRQQVDLDGSYRLFIPAHKKIIDFKQELARQMGGPVYETQSVAEVSDTTSSNPSVSSYRNPTPDFQSERASEGRIVPPASTAEPVVSSYRPVEHSETVQPTNTPAPVSEAQQEPAVTTEVQTATPSNVEIAQVAYTQESYQPNETSDASSSAIETSQPSREVETSASSYAAPKRPIPEFPSKFSTKSSEQERMLVASRTPVVDLNSGHKLQTGKGLQEQDIASERAKLLDAQHGQLVGGNQSHVAKDQKFKESEKLSAHQDGKDAVGRTSAYRIQEGDTLYSIARKHEIDVDELKKMNHLARAEGINYGQTLVVPETKELDKRSSQGKNGSPKNQASTKYTAHDGETLFSISKRFNVSVADLRKWNGIKEDKQFRAGMNITVSGDKN